MKMAATPQATLALVLAMALSALPGSAYSGLRRGAGAGTGDSGGTLEASAASMVSKLVDGGLMFRRSSSSSATNSSSAGSIGASKIGSGGGGASTMSERRVNGGSTTVGAMVMELLSGSSLKIHEVVTAAQESIGIDEAVEQLEGKLPEEVATLVRLKAKEDPAKDDAATPKFNESSLAKARGILNGMVEGSQSDLDAAIIKCKEFEERNRETFAQVVKDLARLGTTIANLERKRVGAMSGIVEKGRLYTAQSLLLESKTQAYTKTHKENMAKLTVRKNDLAVFDFILSMVKCKGEDAAQKPALLGMNRGLKREELRVCSGTGGGLTLDFGNATVQAKLEKLMTSSARKALDEALTLAQDHGLAAPGLLQQGPTGGNTSTPIGQAEVDALVPTDPIKEGAGTAGSWKKCVDGKPNCGLLHDTMSLQWGKFRDLVDELQAEMRQNADKWTELKDDLNTELTTIGEEKTAHMEMLTEVISQINTNTETRDQKDDQHHDLSKEYKQTMAQCKSEIEEILFTNICAVTKVRNSVLQGSTVSPPSKIKDCQVQDWVSGECSMDCDDTCPNKDDPYACGGWQDLKREIVVAPNEFGIACPILETRKKCNQFKCPVDCVMSEWSSWSKCSKACESGVRGKTRSIITKPKNGGKQCDTVAEEEACNTGSCDRNCKLEDWTAWSPCSMACGTGMQERERKVLVPIRGKGVCPTAKNPDRLEDQKCNTQACVGDEICIAQQDLVILIDGSGSLKEEGFNTIRNFAANLTAKYRDMYYGHDSMKVGVVLFGNGEVMPDGTIAPAIMVQELTSDIATVGKKISTLPWQKGFTNLAQAFSMAGTMLQQGGRKGYQSGVLVLFDGKYSFEYQTEQNANKLKEQGTMIYMAPVMDSKEAKEMVKVKEWASQPWETNVEQIPGLQALEHNPEVFAGKLVAKFCSDSISPSLKVEVEKQQQYMLIHESGLPDRNCGTFEDGGRVNSMDECATAARDKGSLAFAFGKGPYVAGHCFIESLKITKELWASLQTDRSDPECPGGAWSPNPYFDVFAMEPF